MVDIKAFPEDRVDKLLSDLEKAGGLADLEDDWTPLLSKVPVAHVKRLSTAVSAWKEREETFVRLVRSLESSGFAELPGAAAEKALVSHKLWALGRAVRMCPKDDFATEEEWAEALAAHVDTWSGAVNLCLKRGEMQCRLQDDHPEAGNFGEYARRRESLSNMPNHRWMASRRGEKMGALKISFSWPESNIKSFVESMLPRMGPAAKERGGDSAAEELIWNDLPPVIRSVLDRRAEDEAIRSAVTIYTDLLKSSPLCDGPVGSIAIGSATAKLGVAVVSDFDELSTGAVIEGTDWEADMLALLRGHGLTCVLVPSTAPDKDKLALVRKVLAVHFSVIPVRSAALAEGRIKILQRKPDLAPELASALVLANRALNPATAWSEVDPVNIGLAEYQNDIDKNRLATGLTEARRLFFLDRHAGETVRIGAKPSNFVGKGVGEKAVASRLKPNPLVKSIGDLKSGMMVSGVVSNITRFGVFVNLGLEEEAMIHISELSDRFTNAPEEVVSLGQQVNARVLEVDVEKKRVALTLKNNDKNGPLSRSVQESKPPDSHKKPMGERRGKRTRDRNEALRQLEDLFKK